MYNTYLTKTGELCEMQGHIGLYLDERLPDIDGLHRYECVSADESIAPGRWKGFTDDNEEDGFLGLSLTIGEYIEMTEDEIRELVD